MILVIVIDCGTFFKKHFRTSLAWATWGDKALKIAY